MTASVEKTSVLRLPVGDMRYPGTRHDTVAIKKIMEEKGFKFSGPIDKNGFQDTELPQGWSTEGDQMSTQWWICNPHGRRVMYVTKKIPWGDDELIHFIMVECL